MVTVFSCSSLVRLAAVLVAGGLLKPSSCTQMGSDPEIVSEALLDKINGQCARHLERSLALEFMAPLDDKDMNGFNDSIDRAMKTLDNDDTLRTKEDQLLSRVRFGLEYMQVQEDLCTSVLTPQAIVGEHKPRPGGTVAGPSSVVGNHQIRRLPETNPKILFSSAIDSEHIFDKLIGNVDPNVLGYRTIPYSNIQFFTTPMTTESRYPRIHFVCPALISYNPLALGKALAAQRAELHKLADEVVAKIKDHLFEEQVADAQLVFTGHGSAAIVAQLAAIKLNFDSEFTLYHRPHRVISIVFGDVRIFSKSFVDKLGEFGFDHHDHVMFCSTEAYLPSNLAAHGVINFVGRRIEFSLKDIKEQYVEKSDGSHASVSAPLTKYLDWSIYRILSIPSWKNFVHGQSETKANEKAEAIQVISQHFQKYRLEGNPQLALDCQFDPYEDESKPVPSSLLKCTVKYTDRPNSFEFAFRVFWVRDVHDLNGRFRGELRRKRHEAYQYVKAGPATESQDSAPAVQATGKARKGKGLANKQTSNKTTSRFNLLSWVRFFRKQISKSPSAVEKASICLNPFFEESDFFDLKSEQGKVFYFSMEISAEGIVRLLLSRNADDQRLVRTLFGPVDPLQKYNYLSLAKDLFRAPLSPLTASNTESLAAIVKNLFSQSLGKTNLMDFIHFDQTAGKWGDYKIDVLGELNMDKFQTDMTLPFLVEELGKAESCDCTYSLPALQCPHISLLGIESPFWDRVFTIGNPKANGVYISFRGYKSMAWDCDYDFTEFAKAIKDRQYDKAGAGLVLKVTSPSLYYGNWKYVFFMTILQDPPLTNK